MTRRNGARSVFAMTALACATTASTAGAAPDDNVSEPAGDPDEPMELLSSYVLGRWQPAAGDLTTLVDPTSEAALASVGSGGIDFRAVLDFARTKGGPALRRLSFAERGKLLAAMAGAIHGRRDELIEISIRSGGTTRGDAKFDIDCATCTFGR